MPRIEDVTEEDLRAARAARDNDARLSYHGYLDDYAIARHNILDPLDPKVSKVLTYLQGITDKLLRASGVDPIQHPVKIVLYATPNNSAALHFNADPPLIGINHFHWDKIPNEDTLAHYIAHELTHSDVRKYTGLNNANSTGEEIVAEGRGILTVAEAGYDPQAVIKHMREPALAAFAQQAHAQHTFGDDHAAAAHDLRAMENALAVYERAKGRRYDGSLTKPIPSEIQTLVREMPAKSHLESSINYTHFYRSIGQLDPLEKILLLKIHIESGRHFQQEDFYIDLIKRLAYDPNNVAQRQEFDLLACTIINHGSDKFERAIRLSWLVSNGYDEAEIRRDLGLAKDGSIYTAADTHVAHGTPRYPIGELDELSKYIRDFASAENSDIAAKNAVRALEIMKHYPGLSNIWDFTSFNIPSIGEALAARERREPIELPYIKHLKWVKDTGNADIAKLLLHMSVAVDPYAKPILDPHHEVSLQKIIPLNRANDGGDFYHGEAVAKQFFEHASRDHHGNVLGASLTQTVVRAAMLKKEEDWLRSEEPRV